MSRLFILLFLAFTASLAGKPAHAAACYAVTPLTAVAPPRDLACAGAPERYQNASLWLKIDLGKTRPDALYVHQTRFERLTVLFTYADGSTVRQGVSRGNYGTHWRVGGQIAFEPPVRSAPLANAVLRFDRLASDELLRIRVLDSETANVQGAILPVLVGCALTLLGLGALYTFSVGAALRRTHLIWHGLWAFTMVAWGLLWSQLGLAAVPALAGWSSQICTFLASLAVTLATVSAVDAIGHHIGPRWARFGMLGLGIFISLVGIPVALETGPALGWQRDLLGILTLIVLALVTMGLLRGCRAGNHDAKALAWAWFLPMTTLALTQFVNMDGILMGGGAQLAMLLTAALQTVSLVVIVTIRIAHLREERDSAVEAEARMSELASRDALTGLLNRRGFVERAEFMIEGRASPTEHFGLLLIDIDHFKRVNDTYGHAAGDAVLCRIARRLERWEGPLCIAGRLGGEEFVLGVTGLTGIAISQFAESVRREIAACHHPELRIGHAVTVSIGIAWADHALSFQRLYGWADQELYKAKSLGRNRIACRAPERQPQALAG